MNEELLIYSLLLLIAAVLWLASLAIAEQCASYDTTQNSGQLYKDSHGSNMGYVTSNLVSVIVVIIVSFIGIYLAATDHPTSVSP